jgi:hypothetical protein
MRQWIRSNLTYANVMVTILAFIVLGGGTALAAYVVSSNSQIGPGTVSGHKPPTGKHANIIAGSVNATDLANQAVGLAKLKAPEAWHEVGPGSTTENLCADPSNTGVFCSYVVPPPLYPWHNYGGGFATAGFYRDQLGIVHLKGVVQRGVTADDDLPERRPIFRLPPAYSPANNRVFPSVGRNGQGQEVAQARVDVQTDGLVVFEQDCLADLSGCSSQGGYLTLEGISFRPDG